MLSLHGVPLALQVGIPTALLVALVRARPTSISQWMTSIIIAFLYLSAVHVTGLWLVTPWYTAIVVAVALTGIAAWQAPRVRRLPWRATRMAWHSLAWRAVLAIFAVGVLVVAALGRRPPPEHIVDLQFPLRTGVYYVVAGGSVGLLSPHLMTLTGERFRAYRGQSYGIDLVKLGPYGARASGLLPVDPARYAIYGDAVHAPCGGRAVQVQDGLPDMPPPHPDRTQMAGNHVLLDCNGVHVLLAHLQHGSVRAHRDEWIDAGAIIGLVGNSGNSNEPHLHVHAQRPAPAGYPPLSGDPLPIRFNGHYLVRNDRVNGEIAPGAR